MPSTEKELYKQADKGLSDNMGYDEQLVSLPLMSAALLDQQLLNQISGGDVSAFALLYDRHAARLYTLALHSTGDSNAAEQIVVDVFQAIWQFAERLSTMADVSACLIAMTRQRSIGVRRGLTQQSTAPADDIVQLDARASAPPLPQPEARKIRLALQSLPNLQRTVLDLAYYDGLNQAEIADELEQPLSVVQHNMRLALSSLYNMVFGSR